MKNILLTLLIFSCIAVQAQDQTPSLRHYGFYQSDGWKDTAIATQISYWENGQVFVKYEALHDSIRLRKQYSKEGNLVLTIEVFQNWVHDTTYTEDLESGEFFPIIRVGYIDVAWGEYKEYREWDETTPYCIGTLHGNLMIGEWRSSVQMNGLEVVNYNSVGQLDGPYFKYLRSIGNQEYRIFWEGQYKFVEYHYMSINYETGEPKGEELSGKSVRTGVWKQYDRKGELLQTVTYEWLKK